MLVVEQWIVALRGPVGPRVPGNKKPPTAMGPARVRVVEKPGDGSGADAPAEYETVPCVHGSKTRRPPSV